METAQKQITLAEESIISKIHVMRGDKVMIDRDLAELYGVETKRLKEQVNRNLERPPSFYVRADPGRKRNLKVAKCDLKTRRPVRAIPNVSI